MTGSAVTQNTLSGLFMHIFRNFPIMYIFQLAFESRGSKWIWGYVPPCPNVEPPLRRHLRISQRSVFKHSVDHARQQLACLNYIQQCLLIRRNGSRGHAIDLGRGHHNITFQYTARVVLEPGTIISLGRLKYQRGGLKVDTVLSPSHRIFLNPTVKTVHFSAFWVETLRNKLTVNYRYTNYNARNYV